MRIIAIAQIARNGVIGDGADQPFRFAEDFAHFKAATSGHMMIVGRKTHEAIGRWLPNRITIVVTSQPKQIELPTEGTAFGMAVNSVEEALSWAKLIGDDVYVIGGGQVYAGLWDQIDELDITQVHADAEGSVRFPKIDPKDWVETSRTPGEQFDFVTYTRREQ